MAQCMRHTPLDVFAPLCLDIQGEYILTRGDRGMVGWGDTLIKGRVEWKDAPLSWPARALNIDEWKA
jgi:hypothetical protein